MEASLENGENLVCHVDAMVRGASIDAQLEKVARRRRLVRRLKEHPATSTCEKRLRRLEGEGDS